MAQGRAENFLLIVHCIIRCRTVCQVPSRGRAILQRRNLKLESILQAVHSLLQDEVD
ncbi:MAG: hypothetical protein IPN76_29560 [Saprospiraceae bacterium]|nr:hypothetical protein [Saprospiraceae bacterium]